MVSFAIEASESRETRFLYSDFFHTIAIRAPIHSYIFSVSLLTANFNIHENINKNKNINIDIYEYKLVDA